MMHYRNKLAAGILVAPFLLLVLYNGLSDDAWMRIKQDSAVDALSARQNQAHDADGHGAGSVPIKRMSAVSTGFSESPTGLRQEKATLIEKLNGYYQLSASEAVGAALPLLNHPNTQVAEHALDLLVFMALEKGQQAPVMDVLTELASDPDHSLRTLALIKGARIGKVEMLPFVARFMDEQSTRSDEAARSQAYATATRALSLMKSTEAVPYLKALLAHTQTEETRRNNFEALAAIGTPESLAVLKAQIESSDGVDQVNSVLALARVRQDESTDFLVRLIETEALESSTLTQLASSTYAADIFGQVLSHQALPNEQKARLLDTLIRYASDSHTAARTEMSEQMMHFVEDSDDIAMQVKALEVISELGLEATASVLQGYFDSDKPEIRKQAVKYFADYSNADNYQSLSRFLWDGDREVRRHALIAMEMFVGEQDRALLQKASQHQDPFIQQHAQAILQQLGDQQGGTL